jgi:hypothetical protein
MSDYSELVKRLRDDNQKTVELCEEAADAIERQARDLDGLWPVLRSIQLELARALGELESLKGRKQLSI